MANIPKVLAGSNSSEKVECRDELITDILSRVSTKDLIKMSTVSKRWRTLIFEPDFAQTQYGNCLGESIFCLIDSRFMSEQYEFRSYNSQTGNLSILPFSWEGLDSYFQNKDFVLYTASNGLLCFYSRFPVDRLLRVYNPVRKFVKKISMPFEVDTALLYFAEICHMQNTVKFVMAGYCYPAKRRYTLVFDSHSNRWYEGPPPLESLNYSIVRTHLFLNGVIYFLARFVSKRRDDYDISQRRDDYDISHMIVGYDVSQDKWCFSVIVPASVGSIFCLLEWEGNLLVCASNYYPQEENLLALAAREGHSDGHSDVHFAFWILDTKHKQWIRERELDLSHQFHNLCELYLPRPFYTFWKVSASGGVVWFACGYKSVIVYHMKTRQFSTHRLDDPNDWWWNQYDSSDWWERRNIPFVTFEPALMSF